MINKLIAFLLTIGKLTVSPDKTDMKVYCNKCGSERSFVLGLDSYTVRVSRCWPCEMELKNKK